MADVSQDQDYREILKSEYHNRKARNASYSQRAFARDIGLTSARLTDIFKRRQGLSRKTAELVAQKIGFSKAKVEYFCNAVEAIDGRSQASRDLAKQQMEKLGFLFKRRLSEDQFKIISEWYHFTILSLIDVKGFQSSTQWIAQKLGLDMGTATTAIARLKRFGFLKEIDGRLKKSETSVTFQTEIPSECGQSFHRQIMEKALCAIKEQSLDKRDLTSMTLAINPDKIPLAKKMIADFVREFDKEMSLDSDLQKVYGLSVQFFSLEKE